MMNEQDLLPYQASPPPPAASVLVLAPHADDEVFGCGGTLMLHARLGATVRIAILTDGAALGDDGASRVAESHAAGRILGYGDIECWGYSDRTLIADDALAGRIAEAVQRHRVDVLYAPSPHEAHPDHRATALAAIDAVRGLPAPVTLAFYEVGIPLPPTHLVDISPVIDDKRQAMRCFVSQLRHQPYDEQVAALNRYRSYTLGPAVMAAEAFVRIDQAGLRADGPDAWRWIAARDMLTAWNTACGELRTAENRWQELLQSSSWRFTAPLRALARGWRRLTGQG